ncbi:hypothetical protein C8J33_1011502 [Rhizobium sp. PP-CC-3G-465]|nr:hypothetical protein C8J31_105338 [Rhizobium sp. PP-CC-2G-626]TCQ12389.1 hypothetical protein C8J34_1011031 [Rhizobium sp. PP-F2F-G36]TCQ28848.1 hypothetical protein C8J33_1011502 [Rhizobium sp. PP-CC-3G-465]
MLLKCCTCVEIASHCPNLPLYGHTGIVYHGTMVFKRRQPASFSVRLRELVWPRKGFTRGLRYLALRILRLSSSPHSIAMGVAAGAASSATPFVGFHILLALAAAYLFSGNLIAAGIATTLANPLTIPVILASSYEIGTAILGSGAHAPLDGEDMLQKLTHLQLTELWGPVLKPLLLGSLPLAAGSAVVFYIGSYYAARLFQSRRVSRLAEKLKASQAA